MNLRIPVLLLLALLGAATARRGWRAYRHARYDLVTIHRQGAPLSEVLRSLERQTGERILADAAIASNATVHLDLEDAPLRLALQQLAEQTGTFWRTIDAVYGSDSAPERLAFALRGGIPPAQAGWTNLAALPAGAPAEDRGLERSPGEEPGPTPEMLEEARRSGKRVMIMRFDGGAPADGGGGGGHRFVHRETPGEGVVDVDVVRPAPSGPGAVPPSGLLTGRAFGVGPDGQPVEFDASPVWVLLEGALCSRLTPEARRSAVSSGGAPRVAEAVQGKWVRMYSLERCPIPGLRTEMPWFTAGGAPERNGRVVEERSEGGVPGDPLAGAADRIRRHQFERLENLTPEQRARQPLHGPFQTETVDHQ